MEIIKRSGSFAEYNKYKISNAMTRAFVAAGIEPDVDLISDMTNEVVVEDRVTTVDNIKDQIFVILCNHGFHPVAQKYLLYRQEHESDREAVSRLEFLASYCKAENAATASKYDPNANVEHKNIATLAAEINKPFNIRLNRLMIKRMLRKMYGKEFMTKYQWYLDNHIIYKNDETNLANYCASITMYPWLLNGTLDIGGNTTAPTNLRAFCGGFINMVFMVSGMLSGACATPEFLMYMDYFIRKEYGDDYRNKVDKVCDCLSLKKRTLDKVITDDFEQIVYSLNGPTGARNFQSVFWNISYFDKYYFESMFGDFRFPDGTAPIWESLDWLQRRFMKWFNQERLKVPITFPVETMALLTDGKKPKDVDYWNFTAEMYSEGHSFFTYTSDSADSLSSCCRLRNQIVDNEFSYTLGAGGVSTGSKSVLTLNINRLVQYAKQINRDWLEYLDEVIGDMHKFQIAYDENLREMFLVNGMLPLFDAHYIDINRQYLTIGINGHVEAAEFLGIEISDNDEYYNYCESFLSVIEKHNRANRTKTRMFNCEMIPAENVGVKHAKWDKEDGYEVPRDCYNSYFFKVEDESLNVLDKMKLHGEKYVRHLTGGSACHINLSEHPTKAQAKKLLEIAATYGTNYFTFNVPNMVCNNCGHIVKKPLSKCPKCGSENVDHLTRVIGYLKRISSFSLHRQKEAAVRSYTKPDVK